MVLAQKRGPRYVSPREIDDDGDSASDLFASAAAGGCFFMTING